MGADNILIAIVDDDLGVVSSLERLLEREGFAYKSASTAPEAIKLATDPETDILLCDLVMPDISGIEVLKASRRAAPSIITIVMTAHGTIENAVEAMRQGAYDFITKPFKKGALLAAINRATEKLSLAAENTKLRQALDSITSEDALIGDSPNWLAVRRTVRQAAPSSATILLQGESGTGKELVARDVRMHSNRSRAPFVAINCAAIPEAILEAELFGYERGAFTGAVRRNDGKFTKAHGGTLFLDEIGDMPLALQAKLLRVLQEGQFDRIGGGTESVDVRIVCASNKDLRHAVKNGSFREDLFYRINVISITLPPLRERKNDIQSLARYFSAKHSRKNNVAIPMMTASFVKALENHDWPGNVRELQNVIERAVVLQADGQLNADALPALLKEKIVKKPSFNIAVGMTLKETEDALIEATLAFHDGNKNKAASLLGITPRTLYRWQRDSRG